MPAQFYERLKDYYRKVAEVLRGKADVASVFPNPTDKGTARERVYLDFLETHLPSACNVVLGGFLFSQEGEESEQIDVIVTSDVSPQFRFPEPSRHGKSFACIDGTLAVVAVKSILDSNQLREALGNLASIPQHRHDARSAVPGLVIPEYEQWPYKIVYAPSGVSEETLSQTIQDYYDSHPEIPGNRRPDLIHVAGNYCVRRCARDLQYSGRTIPAGTFYATTVESDVAALAIVVERIQQALVASRYIPYYFGDAVYKMLGK